MTRSRAPTKSQRDSAFQASLARIALQSSLHHLFRAGADSTKAAREHIKSALADIDQRWPERR